MAEYVTVPSYLFCIFGQSFLFRSNTYLNIGHPFYVVVKLSIAIVLILLSEVFY